jgi:hypothetical protein
MVQKFFLLTALVVLAFLLFYSSALAAMVNVQSKPASPANARSAHYHGPTSLTRWRHWIHLPCGPWSLCLPSSACIFGAACHDTLHHCVILQKSKIEIWQAAGASARSKAKPAAKKIVKKVNIRIIKDDSMRSYP